MRHSSFKIKVGAPAAMLLAAAVTTAMSSESLVTSPQPCLTWAMSAGAPLAARNARVFLAKEAANHIRALDRMSGAPLPPRFVFDTDVNTGRDESFDPRLDHTLSSHQHAAP
ncbi:MAG: hypothetical protein WCT04_21015 [Planctomycetota bacterium]